MHRITTIIEKTTYWVLNCICFVGLAGGLQACQDEWEHERTYNIEIEEGVTGNLTVELAAAKADKHKVQTRSSEGEFSEQHLHSVYIFVIERPENEAPENCRILARRYFADILPFVKEVISPQNDTIDVARLQLPAVSAKRAQIYAIANLGYTDVQGIANDDQLLKQCDALSNLKELMGLSAQLMTSAQGNVNVERMQGHHLMSGSYGAADRRHFLDEPEVVTLKPQANGILTIHDLQGKPYRCIGTSGPGKPAAIFVHRLDAKITVRVEAVGALKDTPGAYFRLLSWQVLNAPTAGNIYWKKHPRFDFNPVVKNSKVFQRDITQGEDKSWEFTFYQFENCVCAHGNQHTTITAASIANQYNKEFQLTGTPQQVSSEQVVQAFTHYPNDFSNFAYSMRELQEKKLGADAHSGTYEPNQGTDDQTIIVQNGAYLYAPQHASMVRLVGRYFNPNEPAKRMKDDPVSLSFEKEYPLKQFPYWGNDQKPVATAQEALKRTRSATVVYYVHLGYVGGGNFELNNQPLPQGNMDYTAFEKKVNDYNVLRNHHYTYTLKVAGVENIKLEATREEHGNILEQEKQPGAEGNMLESQHFYDLDAHYETRNITIDFTRLPQDYTQGFSFAIDTPFERFRATLKKTANGKFEFVDQQGNPIESIRNHDWDWIHFVWHGTTENPSQSLIDAETGNGISYSETYGGYEHQQTYNQDYLTQKEDARHPYRLLNSVEFSKLVWGLFVQWVAAGKPKATQTATFTMYVDENYYDYNPVNNAQVSWWDFCNQPKRKALYFMEPEETSADQQSWYADAHLAVYQHAIQTLYATSTKNGQVVANVAFGMEALDEFRAKYSNRGYQEHYFINGSSINGLYNTVQWFKSQPQQVIGWKEAETYYNEKNRARVPDETEYQGGGSFREQRRGQWAIYSRNRDLNRNGKLDSYEIRWFVPAIDQYTTCFLGGRPVFENPLFEKDKAVKRTAGVENWIVGVPVLHFMSSTNSNDNQIFWAEEGCSKGNYGVGRVQNLYGIRMARMLCSHGIDDTGDALFRNLSENNLKQDAIFTISHTPNGVPVDYANRVDGKPYYILINKLNISAFRERVHMGDLAQHTHEEKENWLYRSYRIGKNKIGYTSYTNEKVFDRSIKINGEARTWWQVNGVWSDALKNVNQREEYYYRDKQHSLAYVYYEDPDGRDLHHWRMPNLREAAIMSMAFPDSWFNGLITAGTRSENLTQNSTQVPFWRIESGKIYRLSDETPTYFYVRPIQDIK